MKTKELNVSRAIPETKQDSTVDLSQCHKKIEQALKLFREASTQTKDVVQSYEFIEGKDIRGDLDDLLGSFSDLLKTKADGRPKPFSIFESHYNEYEAKYLATEDGKLSYERGLRAWGEVGPLNKRFPDDPAAYIGGKEISLEELENLGVWIASVIDWHKERL
jgi:hypothetical protein